MNVASSSYAAYPEVKPNSPESNKRYGIDTIWENSATLDRKYLTCQAGIPGSYLPSNAPIPVAHAPLQSYQALPHAGEMPPHE